MNNTKFRFERILFEDNHLIIVNKNPGELSQGDRTGHLTLSDSIKYYLKNKYNKPGNVYLGITHRLDRPTSGIIMFCKTSKSLTRVNNMFKEKKVKKTYWAITKKIDSNKIIRLENFLKKNEKQNKSFVTTDVKNGKKSILNFKKIKSLDKYSLLEISLETGRHHQIRAQLSNYGYPIKGDLKYGFKRPNNDGSIHLHSRKIEFTHPVTKNKICLIACPPKDTIWNLCVK